MDRRRWKSEWMVARVDGSRANRRMSFSPEMKEAGLSSCFGRLDEKESRYVRAFLSREQADIIAKSTFSSSPPSMPLFRTTTLARSGQTSSRASRTRL